MGDSDSRCGQPNQRAENSGTGVQVLDFSTTRLSETDVNGPVNADSGKSSPTAVTISGNELRQRKKDQVTVAFAQDSMAKMSQDSKKNRIYGNLDKKKFDDIDHENSEDEMLLEFSRFGVLSDDPNVAVTTTDVNDGDLDSDEPLLTTREAQKKRQREKRRNRLNMTTSEAMRSAVYGASDPFFGSVDTFNDSPWWQDSDSYSNQEDEDLRKAIEASIQEHVTAAPTKTENSVDDDLLVAIAESLKLEEHEGSSAKDAEGEDDSSLLEKLRMEDEIARKIIEQQTREEAQLKAEKEARKQKEADEAAILAAEIEDVLEAHPNLPDRVLEDIKTIYTDMKRSFHEDGGQYPSIDFAVSLAKDRYKDAERKREEVKLEAEAKRMAERQAETREERAARFAAAFEKRKGKK